MKKQYLIGLLGFVTIFVPLANGLLTTNSKLFNSTYTNNEIQNEFIINDQNSQVIVKDLDHDGKASQGDQIDQIQLNANYNEFYSIYEDKTETNLSNEYGLNIYTKNSTNTIKPFYSISYDNINNLNLNEGYLNFDLNSTDNPTWEIWDTKLPDNSQKFIITAEKQENNHQEKIIENKIGEISITPYSSNEQKNPTITSARVTETTDYRTETLVKIEYKIDPGNNGTNNNLNNKYNLTKIVITNKLDNNNPVYSVDKSITNGNLSFFVPLGVDYDLNMTAIFDDPASPTPKTDTFDIIGGNFHTQDKRPKFNYPSAVKIDMQHNILEIQGEISINGSEIDSVWLTSENHDVETWKYKYEDRGDKFYYDIWTPDYTENSVDSIKDYRIGVQYTLNGVNDYLDCGLRQIYQEDRIPVDDLTSLEDTSSYQGNTSKGSDGGDSSGGSGESGEGGGSHGDHPSNNNNTMMVIIIIGVIAFIIFASLIGYFLVKKNK